MRKMKGAIWEFWVFGTIAAFIVIMVYFTMAPFMDTFVPNMQRIGNFDTPSINTSFHQTVDRNTNMWNLWPIAAMVLVFFIFFIASSGEKGLRELRS